MRKPLIAAALAAACIAPVLIGALALGAVVAATSAHAQSYPSKPITMVVALPAGGAVDALARVLAEPMRVALGQTIVVENMGGAGGTLGASIAAIASIAATVPQRRISTVTAINDDTMPSQIAVK